MTPIVEGQPPQNKAFFQSKQGSSFGFQVYIEISILSREFQLAQTWRFQRLNSDFRLLEWHIGWQQARSMLWDTWISHGLKMRMFSMAMAGLETRETRNPAGRKQHKDDMTCLAFTCHEASILKGHTHTNVSCKLGESHTKTSPTLHLS